MNWWMLAGALIIGFIGAVMIHDGKNPVTRWCGLVVALVAGVLLTFGAGIPEAQGYIKPDKTACVYYVFVNADLTCVPYGQEG